MFITDGAGLARPIPPFTRKQIVRAKQGKYPGCLVILLLTTAFVIGGMVGGLLGGGVIWWAVAPAPIARQSTAAPMAGPTVAPTPTATPTPTPAVTPTPTRVVIPTPSTEDIITEILPSVVTIINEQTEATAYTPKDKRVVGTGIIIDSRGFILTNAHVVENAATLNVMFSDGQNMPARLVAYEPGQDLAMLKVEAENLTVAAWGNSNSVRLGQPVMAVGSALGDFPNSVTMGIVSGLNRALALGEVVVYGLIQTDAAINQGNSGGPLINLRGEVVGINTFIIREDHNQGVAQGIGFAIPASSAQVFTDSWINLHVNTTPEENNGAEAAYPNTEPLPASQSSP